MSVLLDENLDHALRNLLGHDELVTTAYMGWAGLKNGELLREAEANGIEVLISDRRMRHVQSEEVTRGIVAASAQR